LESNRVEADANQKSRRMTFTINPALTLNVQRFYDCGVHWAIEATHKSFARCPRCAGDRIENVVAAQLRLERTIRAMRGAFTRARKKFPIQTSKQPGKESSEGTP
jgi:hypothetical protein